jgi:hypothetical protein
MGNTAPLLRKGGILIPKFKKEAPKQGPTWHKILTDKGLLAYDVRDQTSHRGTTTNSLRLRAINSEPFSENGKAQRLVDFRWN